MRVKKTINYIAKRDHKQNMKGRKISYIFTTKYVTVV